MVALRAGGFNAPDDNDMHGSGQKPPEVRRGQPAGPQRQSEASLSSTAASSALPSAAATVASSSASTSAAAAAPHSPVVECDLPVQRLALSPAAEVGPNGSSSHDTHGSTEGSADAHMDLEEVLEPEPKLKRTTAWAIGQMEQALLSLSTSSDGGASARTNASTDSAAIDAMATAIPGRNAEVKQIADFIGSRLCSDSAGADATLGSGKAAASSSRARKARTTSAPVATPRVDGGGAGAAGGTGALYLCGKPGTGKTMSVSHAVQVAVERARADGVAEPKISELNASAFPQPAELYARVHADLFGESSSPASSLPASSSRARSASDSGLGSSSALPGSASVTDHEAELRQFFQALDEAAAEGLGLGDLKDDVTGTGVENVLPTPAPANSRQTSSRSSNSSTGADNGGYASTNSRKRGAGALSLSGRAGKKGRQSVNSTAGGAVSMTGKTKGQSRAKTTGSTGAEAAGMKTPARPLVLVLDEVDRFVASSCDPK